jgi:hypothetical protein
MQRHWTNAHVGLLATCATVLHPSHPDVAERAAAFLVAKSGATATTIRDLCPGIDVESLSPSTDDIDTVMTTMRAALAEVAAAGATSGAAPSPR